MKKTTIVIGGVILIVLLAGAAFIGARLLRGQGLPGLSSGPQVITSGGNTMVRIRPGDIQPAKELPQTPADVRGLYDHTKDNSIFVGTGQVRVTVQTDAKTNKAQTSATHSGPVVEVVVTPKTQVFHDTTMEQFNGPPPSGHKLQQVVEPGTLDDIGESSTITVWGKKTGDRYIADILVYTSPAFVTK